jgi:hypothetical protein
MKTTDEPLHLDKSNPYSQTQCIYTQTFCLTKLLNMAMVKHFEVMLGQTLNHYVQNCTVLSNVITLQTI